MSGPADGARVHTDPRLSRRRRAVARSRRRRMFTRAAAAAAVAVAVWAALWSPIVRVRTVEVVGGRHTSAAEISAAAGLDSATNLLLVSPARVAEDAASLPWVRTARVERKLPGTVVVTVAERRPALTLTTGVESWLVDARGRVLGRGRGRTSLPVLTAPGLEGVEPGAAVVDGAAGAALRAYAALPRSARRSVRAAFAPSVERISFSLEGGLLVRWGAAERLTDKRRVLSALLARLARTGTAAAYVDVRVPEHPAVSGTPARTG